MNKWIEMLEHRQLLTAVSLIDGILTFEGTAGDDLISIGSFVSRSGFAGQDDGSVFDRVSVVIVNPSGSSTPFTGVVVSPDYVREIRVNGGGGNDRVVVSNGVPIEVSQTTAPVAQNANVPVQEIAATRTVWPANWSGAMIADPEDATLRAVANVG